MRHGRTQVPVPFVAWRRATSSAEHNHRVLIPGIVGSYIYRGTPLSGRCGASIRSAHLKSDIECAGIASARLYELEHQLISSLPEQTVPFISWSARSPCGIWLLCIDAIRN